MATGSCGQMVVVDPREPVEIELTPTEPRSDRREVRPPRTDAVAPSGPGRRRPPRLTERGQLLAVTGCVGLLALMIGWAAGRASVPEPVGAPTTTVPPTRSVSGLPLPEPDDAEPKANGPQPTTRRTTTTSTVPDWSEETPIAIHEAVAGLPMAIVATNSTGDYFEIDFASGTVRRRIIRPMFGGVEVRAGPGWVLLMPQDGDSTAWLLEDGAEPVQVEIGPNWEVYWSPGSPVLWRAVIEHEASGMTLEAVRPDGMPTGERIVLPGPFAYPQIGDPLGGVVVDMPGGLYRYTVDGAELLTAGLLFGLSRELLVAYECNSEGACGLRRVDRATGASDTIDVADPADIVPAWSQWPVSPDGSQVLVHVVSIESGGGYGVVERLATLDLDDGSVTLLTRPYSQSVAWSPDGRFVFYTRGQLMALDRTTGATFAVFDEDPRRIDTFAVRPAPDVSPD